MANVAQNTMDVGQLLSAAARITLRLPAMLHLAKQ